MVFALFVIGLFAGNALQFQNKVNYCRSIEYKSDYCSFIKEHDDKNKK